MTRSRGDLDPESLPAWTIPLLHEMLLGRFVEYVLPGAEVLDLGAGSGAWAARLQRAGYRVTCVERDIAGFRLADTACIGADLDQDFAHLLGGSFQAVTAIEVIEHLENPRHFLRQCRRLLADSGRLFVTTPNIECVPARLRFLLDGSLRMFGRGSAHNDPTHISPIHTLMFERMLRDTGLRLIAHVFNDDTPTVTKRLPRLLSALVEPLLGGTKGGDCHIFVIAKAPD
jgi:2-polyprenyl-3-methyl-5-hydroxy-6-metoxy-1,4-benzoquinol methylase